MAPHRKLIYNDFRAWRAAPGGAFTLIELLVVVAIISILSAIAVPNFLEAQTRAKVSRVKNDQRTIVTALETYRVDSNKYPPRTASPVLPSIVPSMGSVEFRPADFARLTTPISYITTYPIDIFENSLAPPYNLIDYWDSLILYDLDRDPGFFGANTVNPSVMSKAGAWGLVSVGPDGRMGHASILQGGSSPPLPDFFNTDPSYLVDYDPTNGTVSGGNVYRFQAEIPAEQIFRF